MKRRLGFVSNSSSASYVLEVGMRQTDFVSFLFYDKEGSKLFDRRTFIEYIEGEIKETKQTIKEDEEVLKEDPQDIRKIWIGQHKDRLRKLNQILKKAHKVNGMEIVNLVCLESGHKISQNIFDRTELCGWTSMWNDQSDMGELMQKIIKILDERKIKYRVNVDSDGF